MPGGDGEPAVQLLRQHHPGQLVRQCQWPQRQALVRTLHEVRGQSGRTTDQEGRRTGHLQPRHEPSREVLTRTWCPSVRAEGDDPGAVDDALLDARALPALDLIVPVLPWLGRHLVHAEGDAVADAPLVLGRRLRVGWPDGSDTDDLEARRRRGAVPRYCSTLAEMIQTGWLGGPSVTPRAAMFEIVFSERASVACPRIP